METDNGTDCSTTISNTQRTNRKNNWLRRLEDEILIGTAGMPEQGVGAADDHGRTVGEVRL
jgi:hypothetical protein